MMLSRWLVTIEDNAAFLNFPSCEKWLLSFYIRTLLLSPLIVTYQVMMHLILKMPHEIFHDNLHTSFERSQATLDCLFVGLSKPNWTPSVIWTLKQIRFEKMIHGIYKSRLHKYFKIKKIYTSYTPFWLTATVCATIIQAQGMRGVGESFELPKGKGRVILKFWRIFIVFRAPELHPDTLFFQLFFIFKQSWQQCKK